MPETLVIGSHLVHISRSSAVAQTVRQRRQNTNGSARGLSQKTVGSRADRRSSSWSLSARNTAQTAGVRFERWRCFSRYASRSWKSLIPRTPRTRRWPLRWQLARPRRHRPAALYLLRSL